MKDKTVKIIEDQATPENLMKLSEMGIRHVEVESYEDIITEAAGRWMYTLGERESLLDRLEERKSSSDYEKLTLEELYYFMIKKHISELPYEAQHLIAKQIVSRVKAECGDESFEEHYREFSKRAKHYLKSICILA